MSVSYNWTVDIDGVVYNKQTERIGKFDTDGTVYTPDLGMKCGFVDVNGDTYDASNSPKGFVDVDGTIYDELRNVIGYVDLEGVVYNAQRIPIGNVKKRIHEGVQKAGLKHDGRKTMYRAAAGVVILLRKHLE